MRKLLPLIFLFFILPNFTRAEIHIFEKYGVDQGLMHMYVYSISQDASGFLWIGTNDGAYRFDGIEFEYFTEEEGLSENFVTKIFTDSKGRVWFGHQSGAVSLLQDGQCQPFIMEEALYGSVVDFYEDEAGRIWILVQNLGLIKLDQNLKHQIYRFSESDPALSCIESIGNDMYLLGTHEQLYLGILDEESARFTNVSPVSAYPGSKVSDIVKRYDGSYIIITQEEGIYSLVVEKNTGLNLINPIHTNDDGDLDNLQEGVLLENGDLIVCSMGSGVLRFSKDASGKYILEEKITSQNGLQSDEVRSIYQDGQGNLWCGMYGEGLSRQVRNNFSFFNFSDTGQKSVYAISGHKQGMLVGMGENILILNNDGEILRTLPLPEILKQDHMNSLYMAPNGHYYLGFEKNGLYHLPGTNRPLKKIHLSNNSLSNSVNHITGDDEFLWISTKHGLCRIENSSGGKKWYTSNTGLPYNSIQAAYIDSENRVFLSTISNYLPYIDPSGILQRMGNDSDESMVSITSVFKDSRGSIWLGTAGQGLGKINEEGISFITIGTGLFSNYCYSISESETGKLLIGHRGALSELDIETQDIQIYGSKDGILGSTYFYPGAIFMDAKDRTWFGTSEGLILYTPDTDKQKNSSPLLNIKALYINGEERPLWDMPFELKAGSYEIRIEYSGIFFRNPEAISYQTMLEGYSSDWSTVHKQREVNYERVNNGTYRFVLRAVNSSGQSSELTSENLFVIDKPFYLSAWFYIMVFLLIAFLFYITVQLREKKLKNEQNKLLRKLDEKSKEIIVKEEIIKERKRAEKVLIDAKMKAELSEKLKTAFLRNMSHEIRTPLNAILGFSNLLKQDKITHKVRDNYIDVINENSTSLLKLIDDILDVSKLETKQLKIKHEECDLKKVMIDMEAKTQSLLDKAGKSDVKLVLAIPTGKDHTILTDEFRFKQVFLKLLDNAVKFTERGRIRFGYTFEDANVHFFVEDSGIGMASDKFEVIFDLFRKEADSRMHLYEGTGLGLTIARLLTNLLGGNIFVESESDKGSVFTLVLPRDPGESPTEISENTLLNPASGKWKDKKILVVEDTDSNFQLIENLLSDTEATIERATSGETALVKYFEEDIYHLIIMDIKLPGIDGYETTGRIRKKDDQVSIIAYTAYASDDDTERIMESGFDDYIVKPSSNETIMEVISSHLK